VRSISEYIAVPELHSSFAAVHLYIFAIIQRQKPPGHKTESCVIFTDSYYLKKKYNKYFRTLQSKKLLI